MQQDVDSKNIAAWNIASISSWGPFEHLLSFDEFLHLHHEIHLPIIPFQCKILHGSRLTPFGPPAGTWSPAQSLGLYHIIFNFTRLFIILLFMSDSQNLSIRELRGQALCAMELEVVGMFSHLLHIFQGISGGFWSTGAGCQCSPVTYFSNFSSARTTIFWLVLLPKVAKSASTCSGVVQGPWWGWSWSIILTMVWHFVSASPGLFCFCSPVDVLRPLLCTRWAKWTERPPKVMRQSKRRNTLLT